MTPCAVPCSGFEPTDMPKIAIVAALEREVSSFIEGSTRVARQHEGRTYAFFERNNRKDKDKDRRDRHNENDERNEMVIVCGGIGVEAARRAAEAVIALYRPTLLQSVGFAGALHAGLH